MTSRNLSGVFRLRSEESSEDEEATDATAKGEQDGEDDGNGKEGGGEAPDQVRLALHLAIVPDHPTWAGTFAHDPGNVTTEPESLKSKVKYIHE